MAITRSKQGVAGKDGGDVVPAAPAAAAGAGKRGKKPDVYKPNAVLDVVLLVAYVALTLWTGYVTWIDSEKRMFAVLLGSLVAVALFAEVVKVVFRWLGRTLSRVCHGAGMIEADVMNDAGAPERLRKWMSQSWQLAIHVSMTLCGLAFFAQFPHWWDNPVSVWFANTRADEVDIILKGFYVLQQTIWIYTCFVHVALDDRRKDYYVMYIHHVVTMMLIALSFASDSHRVGFLVMYVHDVSDIFVDSMKMFNYLGLDGPKSFFLTEVSYAAVMTSWVYYRLYEFPVRVIGAVSMAVATRCPGEFAEMDARPFWFDGLLARVQQDCIPLVYTNMGLLVVLLFMHCWWYYLLMRIGAHMLMAGVDEASEANYEGNMDTREDGSKRKKE